MQNPVPLYIATNWHQVFGYGLGSGIVFAAPVDVNTRMHVINNSQFADREHADPRNAMISYSLRPEVLHIDSRSYCLRPSVTRGQSTSGRGVRYPSSIQIASNFGKTGGPYTTVCTTVHLAKCPRHQAFSTTLASTSSLPHSLSQDH